MNKKRFSTFIPFMAVIVLAAFIAWAGMEDRFSDIELKTDNWAEFPEISAPSGNPSTNYGWLYVKDNSGTSDLYFEDDGGTVTELTSASATAWSAISNPTADKTITFDDNEITTLSFADVNEDMMNIRGVGAFGDVSVLRIDQITGDATDGTVLEVVAADANVDPLVVSASGQAAALVVAQNTGNVSMGGDLDVTGALTVGSQTITALTATTMAVSSTSSMEGNVTLDDGATDSPYLIFKDSDDEQTDMYQDQSTDDFNIEVNDASDSVVINVGNLSVGAVANDVITVNGDDFFVADDAEIDGTLAVDTDLDVNGTANISGAIVTTGTIAISENVTFTMAADEYFQMDAATTDSTVTAGALDINYDSVTNGAEGINVKATLVAGGGGSEVVSGIVIDVDDDSDAAGTVIGLDINASDATGSSAVYGIRLGNLLEEGITATNAAAAKTIVIDATTTAQTSTAGSVADIAYRTATTATSAIDLDVESDVAGGASETVTGINITLDDDANTATDMIRGVSVGTDGDATGLQQAFYVAGSGIDAALQANNGYVWIGTGATPGTTPGDDDLFVEGTAEIDGDLHAHGAITGDGATVISSVLLDSEDVTAANSVTAAECGKIFFLNSAAEFETDLPAISTVPAGCWFEFYITAAPADADYTIITGNAKENLIYGGVVEREVDTGDDGPYLAQADTITFVQAVAVISDYVRLVSNGAHWYLSGQTNADGAVTVTQAD
jgi:cytoskeletal protein CcmA (bactofilin family)